jgi:hypothetical protein
LRTSTSSTGPSGSRTSAAPIRALAESGSCAHEAGMWVLAVVEFDDVPAIIVTVFSADHPAV